MKILFGLIALTTLFVACPSRTNIPETSAEASHIVGLLEVRLEAVGSGAGAQARARFVNPALFGKLSSQNVGALPYYTDTNLAFTRRQVSFVDFNDSAATADINTTGATRYISATFDLVNNTPTTFDNLTLHAVSVPGITIGGTGFATVQRGDGTLETNPAVLQKILPADSMGLTQTGITPVADLGDLQWLLQYDGNDLETQTAAFTPPLSVLALDYGFVARSKNVNGRTLASGGGIGQVTFSYKLPKINPRNQNPFGFVIYYVVTNQAQRLHSQPVEQHSTGLLTNPITEGLLVVPGSRLVYREDLIPVAATTNNCIGETAIRIARTNPMDSIYYPFAEKQGVADSPVCYFGASGRRAKSFQLNGSDGNDTATAIATSIAPVFDPHFIMVGTTDVGFGDNDFAIWKVKTNGKSDTNFDTDGLKIIDFAFGGNDQAKAVAIDSAGRIIVVGSSGSDFAIARLTINGVLDTTFSGDGKTTISLNGTSVASGVVIDSTGRIIVVGTSSIGASSNFTIIGLNTDGTIDTSFAFNGKTVISLGDEDTATSVALDNTGKIVIGGYVNSNGNEDFAVVRLTTSGLIDNSFGTNGRQTVNFGGSARAWSVAIYPSSDANANKIILAGKSGTFGSDFAVARLDITGALDPAFDTDGKYTLSFTAVSSEVARAAIIDPNGKLYVGGSTSVGINSNNFAAIRLTATGILDTGFDKDGKATYDINNSNDIASGMILDPYLNLAIAGTAVSATSDFQILVIEE
jgi:uncharacterized delta-60 repeat protein